MSLKKKWKRTQKEAHNLQTFPLRTTQSLPPFNPMQQGHSRIHQAHTVHHHHYSYNSKHPPSHCTTVLYISQSYPQRSAQNSHATRAQSSYLQVLHSEGSKYPVSTWITNLTSRTFTISIPEPPAKPLQMLSTRSFCITVRSLPLWYSYPTSTITGPY